MKWQKLPLKPNSNLKESRPIPDLKWIHIKPKTIPKQTTEVIPMPKAQIIQPSVTIKQTFAPIMAQNQSLIKPVMQPSVISSPKGRLQKILGRMAGIDMEWPEGFISCFCLIDTNGYIKQLHISDFEYNSYKLLDAVLSAIRSYDTIAGYSILSEARKDREDSIDGDWAMLRKECKKFGLSKEFGELSVKIIDAYLIFSNRAIIGTLGALKIKVKYRSNGLGAVAKAYLNETKLEGLSGDKVSGLSPEKEKEYCGRDAKLCLNLLMKNNYELLTIFEVISRYIEDDFFETVNVTGPTAWWRMLLLSRKHCLMFGDDYHWVKSQKIRNETGELTSLIKYTGGVVGFPLEGIYFMADTYDFASAYPSVCAAYKYSSECINCSCCKNDPEALINPEIMKEVISGAKGTPRPWDSYWICRKRETGVLSEIMRDLITKKEAYKLEEKKIEEKAMKLLMNSGYGAFAYVNFQFYDPRVAELITATTRHILNKLKQMVNDEVGSRVLYNDTDSLFIEGIGKINIIEVAKNKYGVTFEHDKNWAELALTKQKKNYFGTTSDGEYICKTLTGMQDGRGHFFYEITSSLAAKERLLKYKQNKRGLLREVKEYVRYSYKRMCDGIRNNNMEFITNKLAYSAVSKKSLKEMGEKEKGWQRSLYNEALSECHNDERLAKLKTKGGELYKYWKVKRDYETTNKRNKIIQKVEHYFSGYPDRYPLDMEKYKDTFWSSITSILRVYGLKDDDLRKFKASLLSN